MKVRLLHNRILVERAKPPEKIGSLYVPQSWLLEQRDKTTEGIVLAVGPGRFKKNSHTERLPMPVKPGDRVWFHPRAGDEGKGKNDTGEMQNFFFIWPDELLAVEPASSEDSDSSEQDLEIEIAKTLGEMPPEALAEIMENL